MTQEHRSVAVSRTRFTIGQIVAGILGLLLVITGGVAMARVGFDSLTGNTAVVLGISHTLVLGIVNVVVGLIFLSSASTAWGVRGTLISMGAVTLAFGAIVMIEPNPFVDIFGDGRPVGLLYLLVGVISLLAGLVTPNFVMAESRYDDRTGEEPTTH